MGVSWWPQCREERAALGSKKDPEVSRNKEVEEETPKNKSP